MDLLRFITHLIKYRYILPPLRGCALLLPFLVLCPLATAEWHVTGIGGTATRLQAIRFDFSSFRSGPETTTTPVIGIEGGRSIWRLTVDGTLLRMTTGETELIVGPGTQFNQTARGRGLLLDGGAEWPVFHLAGFRILARGGYGTAQVHVPTEIPIDDRRRFWTYGFVGTRNIRSRFILRLDVRNTHFRREEIPETLGRFNVMALGAFGLRF